jgi:hypothetical protein
VLESSPRLGDLLLRLGTGSCGRFGPRLQRLLTPRFLRLENLHSSFSQALFVIESAGLSGGYISAGFFDRSLGTLAALG